MSETVVERASDKARRLLQEGRVMVRNVDPVRDYVYAQCRGDSGEVYDMGYDPLKKQWRCTCAARGECSHLQALKLVVVIS